MALLVAAITIRVTVVAPRRAARTQARLLTGSAETVLARVAIGRLALPGFAEPISAPPTAAPPLSAEDQRTLAEVDRRLSSVAWIAREEPSVTCLLGPVRLALGLDRSARLAWERCAVHARGDAQVRAFIGLAVVAIRAASSLEGEQDRAFALEHGLSWLDRVPVNHPWDADAQHDRAFALLRLGRLADAERVIGGLGDGQVPTARGQLLQEPVDAGFVVAPFLPNGQPAP